MKDVFEYVNQILNGKERLVTDSIYNTYMVNRALSYHYDTIMYANEMNTRPNMPIQMQNDFLFHVVRKKKRTFEKWHKHSHSSDIDIIKETYNISTEKARDFLLLLNNDNINMLRENLNKGGMKQNE